jgi:hypothetical protein
MQPHHGKVGVKYTTCRQGAVMTTEQSQTEIVAKHWDKQTSDARQSRMRWW